MDGGGGGQFGGVDQMVEEEQRRVQQDKERETIMQRMLTADALERLKRVKIVKKDLVERVERFLEQQARSGKIRTQVTEAQVIDLLTQIGSQTAEQTITFTRKRNGYGDDDDDEDDSDLM